MTEKELDLIRQGQIALRYCEDGLPEGMHEPMFERMRFCSAVCKGYMRLYNSEKIRHKLERSRR